MRQMTVKDFVSNHVPGVVDVSIRNLSFSDSYISEIYDGKVKDIGDDVMESCKDINLTYVYPSENGLVIGGNISEV